MSTRIETTTAALLLAAATALGACASSDDEPSAAQTEADVAVSVVEDASGNTDSLLDEAEVADGSAQGSAAGSTSDSGAGEGQEGQAVADSLAAPTSNAFQEMSIDLDDPDDTIGVIRVDQAFTTQSYGELVPSAGNILVVIDYELFGTANIFDNAFRLIVGDTVYSPLHDINELLPDVGEVLNWNVIFEVPAGTTEMRFETGITESMVGGARASFDLSFEPTGGVVPYGLQLGTVSKDIPAAEIVGGPQLAQPTGSGNRHDIGDATITPLDARITARDGELFASEGNKLVVATIKIEALDQAAIRAGGFRLKADNEWYSSRYSLIEVIETGEVMEVPVAFEVPVEASTYLLEAGVTGRLFADGFPETYATPAPVRGDRRSRPSATWELMFPA